MTSIAPIHSTTAALLAAIIPPAGRISSDATDALYKSVEPMHELLARCRARAEEINALRRAADRSEESPEVYAHFGRIKQTADAMNRIAGEIENAFDRLTDTMFQFDRYAIETQQSIDGREERLKRGGRPSASPIPDLTASVSSS